MSSDKVKPFANNWAYLKTELRWLDRLLMLAVSRQRQDDRTVRQVANTPADKVTSHWWKGIIAVNRGIDDREGPAPLPRQTAKPQQASVSYSQHLESRIKATYKAKVVLALPDLRDRFALTEVEKNILLIALAPEVNRRYGRLYNYLQEDTGALEDLPTVDLCLRLLCRNDEAWQQARARLTAPDSMVQQGLVEWIGDDEGTLLSQQVRVTDSIVNYLLADTPNPKTLGPVLNQAPSEDVLFAGVSSVSASMGGISAEDDRTSSDTVDSPNAQNSTADTKTLSVTAQALETPWEQLVLPQKLIHQLRHLSRQAPQRQSNPEMPGLMVLLVGESGTGKTIAAGAIAAELKLPLTCVDLEALSLENYPSVLTDAPADDPSLLLVKQGQYWFGRTPQIEQTWLYQWWQWRQQHYGLTLVTAHTLTAIRASWRQKFDGILTLPRPDVKARSHLWQKVFSPDFNTAKLDWAALAKQLPLTGGEIQTIAQTAQMDLKARNQSTLTLRSLRDAILLHHPQIDVGKIKSK
ncbi:MAG: AAA family ATPase [Cyanobacteria bacterium P01_F01_bin.86]